MLRPSAKLLPQSLRLRSVIPLLLRRGARLTFESVLIPALRPIARLGLFGSERDRAAAPPSTAWVPRRPSGPSHRGGDR